jgi:hypothetical protein
MGVDIYIRVGPFIRAKKTATTQVKVWGCGGASSCPNTKRRETYKPAKFCGECGSPFVEIPATEKLSASAAVKRTNGALNYQRFNEDGEFEIFFPNVDYGNCKVHRYDPMGDDIQKMFRGDQVEAELSEFETAFQNEIKTIKEIYGENNVHIYWGVVSDPS